jgi:hypothetical protein
MTLGSDRVRQSFNPSGYTIVDQIKQKSAELIDLCEGLSSKGSAPDGTAVQLQSERNRCVALAQTYFENGAMWAVKAATYE